MVDNTFKVSGDDLGKLKIPLERTFEWQERKELFLYMQEFRRLAMHSFSLKELLKVFIKRYNETKIAK